MANSTAFGGFGRRLARRAATLAFALALAGCAKTAELFDISFSEPGTAVGYEVLIDGAPSDDVAELAEQSLASYRFQDKGAPSVAFLRRRASGDVEMLQRILKSRGYYTAEVKAEVAEAEDGAALVTFSIDPGPGFALARHDLTVVTLDGSTPPSLDPAAFGSPVGARALAADIAKSEGAMAAELRRRGYPYAEFRDRSGLADPDAATLAVESVIDAGALHVFGPVRFEGLATVDEDYLRSYQPWKEGDTFDTQALGEYQRRLFATELFRSASVRPPDESPGAAGPLPVVVRVEEGPRRRIAGGLRYDTDLGPSARVSFEHRNLFGANERLLLQADGGLEKQSVGVGLRKPQFLRPGQLLIADLTGVHEELDAYDANTITGFVGLERRVTKEWRGGLGGLAEYAMITDHGVEADSILFGAPFFAEYDGADDLFDPKSGMRFRFDATPFAGVYDDADTQFLVLDARGSYYLPLDDKRDYVLAARGRVASILSDDTASIPANRRLYSGGGGSVRGYADKSIGPLDADDDPVGGRSAVEAGLELRARVWGDIGGVVFADAGSVSTEMWPDFDDGMQVAAGIGARYYSPAGPIRLDIAFPLNPRDIDDAFQFYFSIGQAF